MARSMQLCVTLENKPGQLAKLGTVLNRAKVNILAISVVDTSDLGIVRLVPSSSAAAKAALVKAGMNICQRPVLTVKVKDQPGTLAAIAKKLADAKVNIEYVYGRGAGASQESLLVLAVDDIEKAATVV